MLFHGWMNFKLLLERDYSKSDRILKTHQLEKSICVLTFPNSKHICYRHILIMWIATHFYICIWPFPSNIHTTHQCMFVFQSVDKPIQFVLQWNLVQCPPKYPALLQIMWSRNWTMALPPDFGKTQILPPFQACWRTLFDYANILIPNSLCTRDRKREIESARNVQDLLMEIDFSWWVFNVQSSHGTNAPHTHSLNQYFY